MLREVIPGQDWEDKTEHSQAGSCARAWRVSNVYFRRYAVKDASTFPDVFHKIRERLVGIAMVQWSDFAGEALIKDSEKRDLSSLECG